MPSKPWVVATLNPCCYSEIKVLHTRPVCTTAMPERPPLLVIDENIASSEHEFLVVEPNHERLWSKALQPASKRRTHWTQAQHRRQQPRQQDQVSLDRLTDRHHRHQAEKQSEYRQVSEVPVDYPTVLKNIAVDFSDRGANKKTMRLGSEPTATAWSKLWLHVLFLSTSRRYQPNLRIRTLPRSFSQLYALRSPREKKSRMWKGA